MPFTQTPQVARLLQEGLVRIVFLPILDLRRPGVDAWEALVRGPAGTLLEGSIALLAMARAEGIAREFELHLLRLAMQHYRQHAPGGGLWINASEDLLPDQRFVKALQALIEEFRFQPSELRIVSRPPEDADATHFAATFERLSVFAPHPALLVADTPEQLAALGQLVTSGESACVKVGRSITRDLATSTLKRIHLQDIVRRAERRKAPLIIEGIETREDLAVVLQLNIPYGQGFLFGRPGMPPEVDLRPLLARLTPTEGIRSRPPRPETIADFVLPAPFVSPRTTSQVARQMLASNHELPGLAVLEEDNLVGWLPRQAAEPLPDDVPVIVAMEDHVLQAQAHQTRDEVLAELQETNAAPQGLPEALVVMWDNLYQGLLLRRHLKN